MKGLKMLLKQEQDRLEEIVRKTSLQLQNVPRGTLEIGNANGYTQYYHCNSGDGNKKIYLHKSQQDLACLLAQKTYDEKVFRLAQKRLQQIRTILKDYQDNEIEQIYRKQSQQRQQIVHPVEMTWEETIEKWEKQEYERKGFADGDAVIYSEKGERVRSKSEKILADFFYRNNIPYHYEKPIYLEGYGFVYPDFTFLSYFTREEVYWEHEGKMDDPAYATSAIKKIKIYENNGINVGEKLILTFETQKSILSTTEIERNVRKFWKMN